MSRYLEHDWFPEPLPDNVVLGERTWLYSTFAFRHYHSRQPVGLQVGHDTGIYNGTFFNLGPTAEISIGNYCTLVGATFCSHHRVTIGDYTFIAHEVVIADSFASIPHSSIPTERAKVAASSSVGNLPILIGENVWIGARAVLLSGAVIGTGAIVAAAAVVDFPVPPYTVVAGNPARIVKKIERPTA